MMKSKIFSRVLCILLPALCTAVRAEGQIFSLIQKNRNLSAEVTVKDAETVEPVSFASVYIVAPGDTVIVDFSLSDKEGKARLTQIPAGKYELKVEMMGYLPYRKIQEFRRWNQDLGEIALKPDHEYLRAATVTAAGRPITVRQDTIEFNASSFKVGQNAMLEDLLKRMPGMQIENGKVTFNGEAIEKITVGGKTFFFNNTSMALTNLPANIVSRIKVIDREKDKSKFSGIATDNDREKIMDVELKDQFKKGWFGQLSAGGGTTLAPKEENSLIDSRGALYSGSGIYSLYGEKDQLVLIGNACNAPADGIRGMSGRSGTSLPDSYSGIGGLPTVAQTGVNYTTDRLGDFESTVSANWKHSGKEARSRSFRTSFQQEGPDFATKADKGADGLQNLVNVEMELHKLHPEKYHLRVTPRLSWSGNHVEQRNRSEVSAAEEQVNSSLSEVNTDEDLFSSGLHVAAGVTDLGKKGRSLNLSLTGEYGFRNGDKTEFSETGAVREKQVRDLRYDLDDRDLRFNADLDYVEPFGERWKIQTALNCRMETERRSSEAVNRSDGSRNDRYSSSSSSRYRLGTLQLQAQYQRNHAYLQFGMEGKLSENVKQARSLGKDIRSGEGEWLLNWAPFVSLRYRKDQTRMNLYYSAYSNPVSGTDLLPVLNIADPMHISTGNVYLRPSESSYLRLNCAGSHKKTFSFVHLNLYGSWTKNRKVSAVWFDRSGVRYTVPVNAKRPDFNLGGFLSYNQPFGSSKQFSNNMFLRADINRNFSYQAERPVDGPDLEGFDYQKFMADFWGNDAGDRFYSGESGFKESLTRSLDWSLYEEFRYNADLLSLSAGGNASRRRSRYSLDEKANTATWSFRVFGDLTLRPGKGWEIGGDCGYRFYRGYAEGYGEPYCQCNLHLDKDIRSFTLSMKVFDLLNQTRNLTRTTTEEFVQDTYTNEFGRYCLLSLSWRFGKKNAAKNNMVNEALWKML